MLAVVGAPGARLRANSVAYCLARSWSCNGSGLPVVLVDVDTSGSALYGRLGEATSGVYSPERRGLPSLMASRSRFTTEVLAEHSYELGRNTGSLWVLLGPRHIEGGGLAAGWLAERFEDLIRIDSERTVVVAASLLGPDVRLLRLLARIPATAVVAPVGSIDDLCGLQEGLAGRTGCTIGLVVEGRCPLGDGEIAEELGIAVAGRLRVRPDSAVLRTAGRRRRSRFAKDIEALASRLDPAARAVSASVSDGAARLGLAVPGAETADGDAAVPEALAAGRPAAVGPAGSSVGVDSCGHGAAARAPVGRG